jgi:hypothetical protein
MTGAHRAKIVASRPLGRAITAHHALMASAKSVVHVVSAVVMWLIVLAIITVVVSAPSDQNFWPADLYGVQRGLAH